MTHLEHDLTSLRRELFLLLNRVRNAVALCGEALLEGSQKKADRVIAGDSEIDSKQLELETHCLEVISHHQLIAKDARFVTGVLGSLGDLERVGDYAVHIATDSSLVRLTGVFEKLHGLFRLLREMSERLSDALQRDDATLARAVRDTDNQVDALIESASSHVIQDFDSTHLLGALATLRVLRAAQRIGDHLENVAERVEFWVSGSRA